MLRLGWTARPALAACLRHPPSNALHVVWKASAQAAFAARRSRYNSALVVSGGGRAFSSRRDKRGRLKAAFAKKGKKTDPVDPVDPVDQPELVAALEGVGSDDEDEVEDIDLSWPEELDDDDDDEEDGDDSDDDDLDDDLETKRKGTRSLRGRHNTSAKGSRGRLSRRQTDDSDDSGDSDDEDEDDDDDDNDLWDEDDDNGKKRKPMTDAEWAEKYEQDLAGSDSDDDTPELEDDRLPIELGEIGSSMKMMNDDDFDDTISPMDEAFSGLEQGMAYTPEMLDWTLPKEKRTPFKKHEGKPSKYLVRADHPDDVELALDVDLLRLFISPGGLIRPRRFTGLTAKQQRRVARAIKISRQLALLPFLSRYPDPSPQQWRAMMDEDEAEAIAEEEAKRDRPDYKESDDEDEDGEVSEDSDDDEGGADAADDSDDE